jgi:hypothetical protein
MKLAYFPNQTAMKSEPVWRAFLEGWQRCGHTFVENTLDADAALIWSVLWNGSMRNNKPIYEHYRKLEKPVFIVEVGSLVRGKTWKVAVNNITSQGVYANDGNFLPDRDIKLGISLKPENFSRKSEILIATQHDLSLQWQDLPRTDIWVKQIVDEIRKYSRKSIVIRPHPRGTVRNLSSIGVKIEQPRKIPDTYDRYDIDFGYHCLINWNSGVALQAAIEGTPVITGFDSLAHEISGKIQDIDSISLPDRSTWFQKILHTEWTTEEMAQGIPQNRLLSALNI